MFGLKKEKMAGRAVFPLCSSNGSVLEEVRDQTTAVIADVAESLVFCKHLLTRRTCLSPQHACLIRPM